MQPLRTCAGVRACPVHGLHVAQRRVLGHLRGVLHTGRVAAQAGPAAGQAGRQACLYMGTRLDVDALVAC